MITLFFTRKAYRTRNA